MWCSWYYCGPHYSEVDFHDDLAYLAGDRLPFEVVLIDESWDMPGGDWQGNDRWPSGMRDAAERIRALGYRPGIWTCPYLAKAESNLAVERPEWLLRLRDGSLVIFPMNGPNYVLDPTIPGVCDWIEALYRRLTEDWAIPYHKLDFMRAVFMHRDAAFYDRSATRLEAYRRGLEAVRRGIGPDAYLSVCGGHFGGSLGLADSQRSGSDVTAMWDNPPALPKLKQNILRTWMSRLWHTDPDAMMVRRRSEPLDVPSHARLSLGLFTDDEARTIAVNQYVGGGLVCFTEKFGELDADRKALYRHVVPSVNAPSRALDYFAPRCPSVLRTFVRPRRGPRASGPPSRSRTGRTPAERTLVLTPEVLDGLASERYLPSSSSPSGSWGLPPGGGRALARSRPTGARWSRSSLGRPHAHPAGHRPALSMGGWRSPPAATGDAVCGRVETGWRYPVRVTAAFPEGEWRRGACLRPPRARRVRVALGRPTD